MSLFDEVVLLSSIVDFGEPRENIESVSIILLLVELVYPLLCCRTYLTALIQYLDVTRDGNIGTYVFIRLRNPLRRVVFDVI